MRLVRERMIRALWVCAWLSIVAGPARAQSGMAVLNGKIVDQQKATLPGATVTLSNAATGLNRTTTTSAEGTYAFPAVPPGRYKLTIELTGLFVLLRLDPIQLTVDTTTSTDVAMVLGNLTKISVRAETPIINSSDASLGNVIGSAQIQRAAARGPERRRPAQPADRRDVRARSQHQHARRHRLSRVRLRQRHARRPVERHPRRHRRQRRAEPEPRSPRSCASRSTSVQEFRVSTSNYSADQGRSSGAQVSLVTRSGTNPSAAPATG